MLQKSILTILFLLLIVNHLSAQDQGIDNITDTVSIAETYVPNDSVKTLADDWRYMLFLMQTKINEQELMLGKYRLLVITLLFILTLFAVYYFLKSLRFLVYRRFPFIKRKKNQLNSLVCLQIIMKHYGKKISYKNLLKASQYKAEDIKTLSDFVTIAQHVGFNIIVLKMNLNQIAELDIKPLLVYLPKHLSVLYKFSKDFIHLSDPYYGHVSCHPYYFSSSWYGSKSEHGIAIVLLPNEKYKFSGKKLINPDKVLGINGLDKRQWKDLPCELFNLSS